MRKARKKNKMEEIAEEEGGREKSLEADQSHLSTTKQNYGHNH